MLILGKCLTSFVPPLIICRMIKAGSEINAIKHRLRILQTFDSYFSLIHELRFPAPIKVSKSIDWTARKRHFFSQEVSYFLTIFVKWLLHFVQICLWGKYNKRLEIFSNRSVSVKSEMWEKEPLSVLQIKKP